MLTLEAGRTLGELMTEAEELLLQLDDPRTWLGRMPRCTLGSTHNWTPHLAMTLNWTIRGRMATLTYPVGILCPDCGWAIGLHLEVEDPIESRQ